MNIFCPGCGTENQLKDKYCRACGNNLQVIQKAMKKGWLAEWVHSKLDNYVRGRSIEKRILQLARGSLFIGLANLYLAWAGWEKNNGASIMFIVMAIPTLIIGGWDYLHYRRRLNRITEKITDHLPESLPTTAITHELPEISADAPFSITEATTLPLPSSKN